MNELKGKYISSFQRVFTYIMGFDKDYVCGSDDANKACENLALTTFLKENINQEGGWFLSSKLILSRRGCLLVDIILKTALCLKLFYHAPRAIERYFYTAEHHSLIIINF